MLLHVVVLHVNSALTRHHTNINHPLLCVQFDSQQDPHPDNVDQCSFIKPCVGWGTTHEGAAPLKTARPLLGGERAWVFPGKKRGVSILGAGGIQWRPSWPAEGLQRHNGCGGLGGGGVWPFVNEVTTFTALRDKGSASILDDLQ